jgi:chromate transporter
VVDLDKTSIATDGEARAPHRIGLVEIFLLFSQLGLSSFGGGVSAWIHRAFVERRGWLDETEFSALLGLGRIMPGANVVNLAILVGQRLRGAPGAVVAALGLLVGPSLTVIALAVAYHRFADTVGVHGLLEGTAAAAVGLLVGMGVKSGSHIVRAGADGGDRTLHNAAPIVIMAAIFVLIGVLRLPTAPIVLCLAPVSIALAFFSSADGSKRKHVDG